MKDERRTKRKYAVKVYQEGADILLAACDAELIDMTFRDKGRGIKIHVSREFYHGDVVGLKRLEELMSCSTILNLVGKRTVNLAKSLGLVDERGVIVIGTVPHAQVVHLLRGR
jgi:hypothetical protein